MIGQALIKKAFEPSIIEKHRFGNYEVRLYEGKHKGQSGYLFDVYNENNEKVASLLYSKKDNISMKDFNNFVSMKTVDEKNSIFRKHSSNMSNLI